MKVILKQDVKNLGRKGDTVEVAEGYARNYLLPRGLVVEASAGAMRSLEQAKRVEMQKEERAVREAQALREKLHEKTVTVKARVGEGGKLFGSVTAKDVADACSAAIGKPFDKKSVELKEPIKALGQHAVTLHLGHQVTAVVNVHVVEA